MKARPRIPELDPLPLMERAHVTPETEDGAAFAALNTQAPRGRNGSSREKTARPAGVAEMTGLSLCSSRRASRAGAPYVRSAQLRTR